MYLADVSSQPLTPQEPRVLSIASFFEDFTLSCLWTLEIEYLIDEYQPTTLFERV
jgi:hypothetical protein